MKTKSSTTPVKKTKGQLRVELVNLGIDIAAHKWIQNQMVEKIERLEATIAGLESTIVQKDGLIDSLCERITPNVKTIAAMADTDFSGPFATIKELFADLEDDCFRIREIKDSRGWP